MSTLEGWSRYAVYYAPPPDSLLAATGASWFGVDTASEETPPPPVWESRLRIDRERLTRKPRRYGFHATLKAPFTLAEGVTPQLLDDALAALAEARAPITTPRLMLDDDMGFFTLRPQTHCGELDDFAAACVTELDLLRAPLSPKEQAERRRGLDSVESAHLRDWGYPHVLDRFHFHITLTDQVPWREADTVREVLETVFADALGEPLTIDAMALFGDPGKGEPFRLLRRYPLLGAWGADWKGGD